MYIFACLTNSFILEQFSMQNKFGKSAISIGLLVLDNLQYTVEKDYGVQSTQR